MASEPWSVLVCVLLPHDEVEVVAREFSEDCVVDLKGVGCPWAVAVYEVEEPDESA